MFKLLCVVDRFCYHLALTVSLLGVSAFSLGRSHWIVSKPWSFTSVCFCPALFTWSSIPSSSSFLPDLLLNEFSKLNLDVTSFVKLFFVPLNNWFFPFQCSHIILFVNDLLTKFLVFTINFNLFEDSLILHSA